MKKIILPILITSSCAFAYTDSDIDGVEDLYDKCRDTPFSDLVDNNGCSTKSLSLSSRKVNYDIVLGGGYSNINYSSNEKADTTTSSFQADVFYDNWTLQTLASRYSSTSQSSSIDGFEDTQINLFYTSSPLTHLTLTYGLGILLPTYKSGYDNEASDYSAMINAHYTLSDDNYLFGAYGFTQVNDNDTEEIEYQNTNTYRIGIGQNLNKSSSIGLSYGKSDSIYKNVLPIETIGSSVNYQINNHWFSRLDYDYGLSDSASDHAGAISLGYYF